VGLLLSVVAWVEDNCVGFHPLGCGGAGDEAFFACFECFLVAEEVYVVGAVHCQPYVVFFSVCSQFFGFFLFYLGFLPPSYGFVFKGVKSLFLEKAGKFAGGDF